MREVNATDFKNQFAEFLDLTKDEAIGIRKSGKLTAVMVSAEEYEHLRRLEDAYWVARAVAACAGWRERAMETHKRCMHRRAKESSLRWCIAGPRPAGLG